MQRRRVRSASPSEQLPGDTPIPEALLATGPDEFFETVEQIARRLRA
ncbi:MAG: hypothetical protein WHS90_02245 [Caldilinea sp.]